MRRFREALVQIPVSLRKICKNKTLQPLGIPPKLILLEALIVAYNGHSDP